MLRKGVVSLVVVGMFLLSGCATFGKKKDLEMQGLKNQISALESQMQAKDEEINSLKEALDKTTMEKQGADITIKGAAETKSRPSVKQIQVALRNAGYNPGACDGRMGRQTRDAIKAFQKDNNLLADGKVGKRTWSILRQHLDKKVK